MKTINVHLGWETDNGNPPPQQLLDQVSANVRLWLHEQGLEGSLESIEKNGKQIANIKLIKPDEWQNEDLQDFCKRITEFVSSMCKGESYGS